MGSVVASCVRFGADAWSWDGLVGGVGVGFSCWNPGTLGPDISLKR